MISLRTARWLALASSVAAAGCSSPPPNAQATAPLETAEITVAQAQGAVDDWMRDPKAPGGTVVVVSVREMHNQNWITADMRVKDFVDEGGHITADEQPAQAVFFRGGSGIWMLTRVVWDGGHMTATPEVDVK